MGVNRLNGRLIIQTNINKMLRPNRRYCFPAAFRTPAR